MSEPLPHHQLRDFLRRHRKRLPAELQSAGALLVLRELAEWRSLDPSTRQIEEATGQARTRVRRHLAAAVRCRLLVVVREATAGGPLGGQARRYALGPMADDRGDATPPQRGDATPPRRGDARTPPGEASEGTSEGTDPPDRGDAGTPSPNTPLRTTPPLPPRGGEPRLRIAARGRRGTRHEVAGLVRHATGLGVTVTEDLEAWIRRKLRDGWTPVELRRRLEEHAGGRAGPRPQLQGPDAELPSHEGGSAWERVVQALRTRMKPHSWLTWIRGGTWGHRVESRGEGRPPRLVVGVDTEDRRSWITGCEDWQPLFAEALEDAGLPGAELSFRVGLPGG